MIWFPIIFIIDFVVAYVWVKSIQAIEGKKPFKAANTAAAMTLLAAITVISYTSNWWLVIPAVSGTWLGTYISVRKRPV
jgi:uncharacterized membrane protein YfcA